MNVACIWAQTCMGCTIASGPRNAGWSWGGVRQSNVARFLTRFRSVQFFTVRFIVRSRHRFITTMYPGFLLHTPYILPLVPTFSHSVVLTVGRGRIPSSWVPTDYIHVLNFPPFSIPPPPPPPSTTNPHSQPQSHPLNPPPPTHPSIQSPHSSHAVQLLQRVLAEQYLRALSLVREHRGKIDALSDALLSNGVVHKAELEAILGEKVRV